MFCVHIFLVQTLDYMTNDWQPTKLAFKKETTSIRMYKQLILFGILIWFICALFANDGIKIAFRITKFIATLKIWQISVTFFRSVFCLFFAQMAVVYVMPLLLILRRIKLLLSPRVVYLECSLLFYFYFCIFSHCRRLHHLPLAKNNHIWLLKCSFKFSFVLFIRSGSLSQAVRCACFVSIFCRCWLHMWFNLWLSDGVNLFASRF